MTPGKPFDDLVSFCSYEHIQHMVYQVEKAKDAVVITPSDVASILEVLIRAENHPLYLHCLDGANVTGMIVMCLRKMQHWNTPMIYEEFMRYSHEGELSPEDSEFLSSFKADIQIPHQIPSWLWGGFRPTNHPTLRLKFQSQRDDARVERTAQVSMKERVSADIEKRVFDELKHRAFSIRALNLDWERNTGSKAKQAEHLL